MYVFAGIRQILLSGIMVFVIVGIFVTDSMSQFSRPFIMCVLQIGGNFVIGMCLHKFHRTVDRHNRRIALWCARHIRRRLCKDNPCLRHAKLHDCLRCRRRHDKCLRIRIAHILRCTDHNTSCNKSNAFASI